jgi:hypothetical protein
MKGFLLILAAAVSRPRTQRGEPQPHGRRKAPRAFDRRAAQGLRAGGHGLPYQLGGWNPDLQQILTL